MMMSQNLFAQQPERTAPGNFVMTTDARRRQNFMMMRAKPMTDDKSKLQEMIETFPHIRTEKARCEHAIDMVYLMAVESINPDDFEALDLILTTLSMNRNIHPELEP